MYIFDEVNAITCFEHDKLLDFILKNGVKRKYRAGNLLYYFGEKADGLYYIASGKIRGFYLSEDGDDQTNVIVPAGLFEEEDAFTSSLTRVVGVDIVSDAELYYIERDQLLEFCKNKPEIIHELLGVFVKKMFLFMQQVNAAQQNTARKKLAFFLSQMSLATHEAIDFTHERLADVTGLSRVKVSQTLSEFENEGLIRVKYRQIEILDFDALFSLLQ